jgi:hypothetical protein
MSGKNVGAPTFSIWQSAAVRRSRFCRGRLLRRSALGFVVASPAGRDWQAGFLGTDLKIGHYETAISPQKQNVGAPTFPFWDYSHKGRA